MSTATRPRADKQIQASLYMQELLQAAPSPVADEDEPTSVTWSDISCAEYDAKIRGVGTDLKVYSTLTDICGRFGKPRIETVWCRASDPDRPLLRAVRHPNEDGSGTGPDVRPCTHSIAS